MRKQTRTPPEKRNPGSRGAFGKESRGENPAGAKALRRDSGRPCRTHAGADARAGISRSHRGECGTVPRRFQRPPLTRRRSGPRPEGRPGESRPTILRRTQRACLASPAHLRRGNGSRFGPGAPLDRRRSALRGNRVFGGLDAREVLRVRSRAERGTAAFLLAPYGPLRSGDRVRFRDVAAIAGLGRFRPKRVDPLREARHVAAARRPRRKERCLEAPDRSRAGGPQGPSRGRGDRNGR